VIVDIGKNNSAQFNNIKMMLVGPNMDVEVSGFQANMNFETEGNEKCIKEFFAIEFLKKDKENLMYCLVKIMSGTIRLNGCILSLE
jgi:hypothetical protein